MGAAYFQQGSTDSAIYENAREKFFRTKELLAEVSTVMNDIWSLKNLWRFFFALIFLKKSCVGY